jgi:hypothetical protein
LPIQFVRGTISLVRVRIPWKNILTESCLLEISGLDFVVEPICDTNLCAMITSYQHVLVCSFDQFCFSAVSQSSYQDLSASCHNLQSSNRLASSRIFDDIPLSETGHELSRSVRLHQLLERNISQKREIDAQKCGYLAVTASVSVYSDHFSFSESAMPMQHSSTWSLKIPAWKECKLCRDLWSEFFLKSRFA